MRIPAAAALSAVPYPLSQSNASATGDAIRKAPSRAIAAKFAPIARWRAAARAATPSATTSELRREVWATTRMTGPSFAAARAPRPNSAAQAAVTSASSLAARSRQSSASDRINPPAQRAVRVYSQSKKEL
jgi:hypothetical protein